MTYSVYFHYRGMTMMAIRKSDCLEAGMLECAYDDIFVWHDVEEKDLHRVVKYIGLEFKVPMVEIAEENYINPSFCHETEICTVFYTEKVRN